MTDSITIIPETLFALNGSDVSREDAETWLTEQAASITTANLSHEAGVTAGQLGIGAQLFCTLEVLANELVNDLAGDRTRGRFESSKLPEPLTKHRDADDRSDRQWDVRKPPHDDQIDEMFR